MRPRRGGQRTIAGIARWTFPAGSPGSAAVNGPSPALGLLGLADLGPDSEVPVILFQCRWHRDDAGRVWLRVAAVTFGPTRWDGAVATLLEQDPSWMDWRTAMATGNRAPKIVVGVDGSEASVEALRQAQRLAVPLGAEIEATGCWEYPQMYVGYEMMGIEGFEERAGELLQEAVTSAFGPHRPGNVRTRLVHGSARQSLIDASGDADLLVVGRRGQGGFGRMQQTSRSTISCRILPSVEGSQTVSMKPRRETRRARATCSG